MRCEKKAGFTLIELSVVLTVLALIAGSALSIGASRIEARKFKDTNERLEDIIEGLEEFVDSQCRLPCPADGSDVLTDANFGIETLDADGAGALGQCSVDEGSANYALATHLNVGATNETDIVAGILPARTLGLHHRYMFDGWQRRLTYVVDERLTWSANANNGGWQNPAAIGQITVNGDGGNLITSEAVVVIISHGPNGHGAWRIKGSSRLDKVTAAEDQNHLDEIENAWEANGVNDDQDEPYDAVFIQKFREESAADNFDDIVVFRTKWQFPDCP